MCTFATSFPIELDTLQAYKPLSSLDVLSILYVSSCEMFLLFFVHVTYFGYGLLSYVHVRVTLTLSISCNVDEGNAVTFTEG